MDKRITRAATHNITMPERDDEDNGEGYSLPDYKREYWVDHLIYPLQANINIENQRYPYSPIQTNEKEINTNIMWKNPPKTKINYTQTLEQGRKRAFSQTPTTATEEKIQTPTTMTED